MVQLVKTPYRVLSIAAVASILCITASVWLATNQPWLGLELRTLKNTEGALVDHVEKDSPAALILSPGDNILSLRAATGAAMKIQPLDLVEDPDVFPTFGQYRAFLTRQAAFTSILREPVVVLSLEDGRDVKIKAAPTRPLRSLPIQFWVLNIIGMIIFMIGTGVLSVSKDRINSWLFFGSGLGLLLTTTSIAVVVSREIAFDPDLLLKMRLVYHTGNSIFTVFGISLLYHYPTVLSRFPLSRLAALLVSFFWLNERFEWMDFPGHTTFVQPIIYFAIGAIIGILQWRASRGRPVDRAALKWFLLSFLGFVGLAMFIYFVPVVTYGTTLVPIATGLTSVMFMYIGLALGIIKYRLFDIDRWWFNIWVWFFAGVTVLVIDGTLSVTFISQPSISMVIALILVGWIYFPFRQWVWGKVYGKSPKKLEFVLPIMVAAILYKEGGVGAAWKNVMREVFRPLSLEETPEATRQGRLEKHGEVMVIPAFEGGGSFELKLADRGTRLFSPADLRLAREIREIAIQTESRLAAYNRGVGEERERIMRDLHDDIGGRLLTLVHTATRKKDKQFARETLKALRDITYSIVPDRSISVEEALANWRYEMRERCEGAGVSLHWNSDSSENVRLMTPRQLTNISRVLSEAASNAFSHAGPKNIWIDWDLQDGRMGGVIRNDGNVPENSGMTFGKGIKNMERRISDLGGSFDHESRPEDGFFEVRFNVPLQTED